MRQLAYFPLVLFAMLFTAQLIAQPQGEAKRAIVTSAIDSREPVDNLNDTVINTDVNKVYFFTEILNQADTSITHRWFLNGKLEAEVVLRIGSNRWRTYSSKNLVPSYHQGNWQVEVVDDKGKLLGSTAFVYGQ